MYTVTTGIHIHFAHHVRGHLGPCISLHGHTWLFQVTLAAQSLDHQGFVADFDILHEKVLAPCHALLDHSLCLGEESYREVQAALATVGNSLVASRQQLHGHLGTMQTVHEGPLSQARNESPGGIKVCVFPFTPTSERIAEWLFRAAQVHMEDDRVRVERARIYETLHPVESYAEFAPSLR